MGLSLTSAGRTMSRGHSVVSFVSYTPLPEVTLLYLICIVANIQAWPLSSIRVVQVHDRWLSQLKQVDLGVAPPPFGVSRSRYIENRACDWRPILEDVCQ